ncbi:hypothetical protein BJ508DRAFT_114447 [Ascobolus immersus RN42]|uniref:Uncharacterized protein n=1 Tax=Ascobolus immersus RN42 TaxID=1160509 RepID=A0A3N4I5N7_ASCIM|nr:hypothetical protein BJ508DRAFT_114447 [Ascobolus immersus RN42]
MSFSFSSIRKLASAPVDLLSRYITSPSSDATVDLPTTTLSITKPQKSEIEFAEHGDLKPSNSEDHRQSRTSKPFKSRAFKEETNCPTVDRFDLPTRARRPSIDAWDQDTDDSYSIIGSDISSYVELCTDGDQSVVDNGEIRSPSSHRRDPVDEFWYAYYDSILESDYYVVPRGRNNHLLHIAVKSIIERFPVFKFLEYCPECAHYFRYRRMVHQLDPPPTPGQPHKMVSQPRPSVCLTVSSSSSLYLLSPHPCTIPRCSTCGQAWGFEGNIILDQANPQGADCMRPAELRIQGFWLQDSSWFGYYQDRSTTEMRLIGRELVLDERKDFRALVEPKKRWRKHQQKYYAGRSGKTGVRRVRYEHAVEDVGTNYKPTAWPGQILTGPDDPTMTQYEKDVPLQPTQSYRELPKDYGTEDEELVIEDIPKSTEQWLPPYPTHNQKKQRLLDYCRDNKLGMCCRGCAKIEKSRERKEKRAEWRAFWKEAGGLWKKGDSCFVPPKVLAHTEENRACCHACYYAVRDVAPWDDWDWNAPKAWYGGDWVLKEGISEVYIDTEERFSDMIDLGECGLFATYGSEGYEWDGYWGQYPLEWRVEDEVRCRKGWGVLVDWALENLERKRSRKRN